MRARNPLYVMAKPPPKVQAAIAALLRGDSGRGPDLLHVTLISLYDLHYAPPEWLPATPKSFLAPRWTVSPRRPFRSASMDKRTARR